MFKTGKLGIAIAISGLVFPLTSQAQISGKIGILHVFNAIAQCAEGKQALGDFQKKAEAKQADLEKKNGEIQSLQKQLQEQSRTLNDESRAALTRNIDLRTTEFQRAQEDARKEFTQMQQEIVNRIGSKLVPVVQQYASENKFTLVVDSSQSNQLVYWDPTIDITEEIIKRYDSSSAAPAAAPSGAPPTPPTTKPN